MSTAAVSASSIYQELQTYFQARNSDLQQLGQALQSGDLAGAQQEFQAIQTLGQSGPSPTGIPSNSASANRISKPSARLCSRETWRVRSRRLRS